MMRVWAVRVRGIVDALPCGDPAGTLHSVQHPRCQAGMVFGHVARHLLPVHRAGPLARLHALQYTPR